MGSPGTELHQWMGRSLVFPLPGPRTGVIKFANSPDNIAELNREHFWQTRLAKIGAVHPEDTQIPHPLICDGKGLFRIQGPLPAGYPPGLTQGICIGYTVYPQYFEYPNETVDSGSWSGIRQAFLPLPVYWGALPLPDFSTQH